MKVAVLRALMLGDLLCATPALRALRHGLPQAHISLVGLPWARALAGRLASVDDFIDCPGWPGLPEQPVADQATRVDFIEGMRRQRFHLGLQMHGSGAVVNALVAAFGAERNAGFADAAAWRPAADAARFAHWPRQGSEVERLLALTDHLGLPRQGLQLDFPLQPEDRAAAEPLWQGVHGPIAIVHAGSQLPSRRWPPERFAAVADAMAGAGMTVMLTGTPAEAGLVRRVAEGMRHAAIDLAGRTTLWTLGALVERAAVLVCNDTGLSHVAAALGRPSVVVASGSDVARWAPADARRHRVLWADAPCRPCALAECPVAGHPCSRGVDVEEVRDAAWQALQKGSR